MGATGGVQVVDTYVNKDFYLLPTTLYTIISNYYQVCLIFKLFRSAKYIKYRHRALYLSTL